MRMHKWLNICLVVFPQARLDDENERLQKKQLAYQRQGHGEQEDEEMTKYYHNAVFKIQILKARIIRVCAACRELKVI